MGKVKFIGDKSWEGFDPEYIYDVDFEYTNDSWFVYTDKYPFFLHHGRCGYRVCEHKYLFEIILNV
jgi:hypothetical protein